MASAQGVRAGRAFVEIGADPRKLFAALKGLERNFRRIGSSATEMGAKITAIGAGIAVPIALAVRQFASFDDAIRATAAVSGASGDSLQMLTDRARELGRTTSFTAVQVANLMTELGRAGFSPDQINVMTASVLSLARATGTDATLAAGIMSATLRQFSLDAGEAARVSDVLTKAANSTFNTVEGLGESLKYAGPVAASLGMSLEDTVAILGTLGNVGIQGSEAGTALRRLSVISAATGEQLQSLFGVSNVDAAGNLKPLVDVLDEISKATATMPVAERTAKMSQAFGLLGITSANVLSQTAGGVRGLAAELRNASGTADQTAQMMDAGLGGSFRVAMSAIEGAGLALADGLEPGLKSVTNVITGVTGGLTTLLKNNKELVATFGTGLAVFTASGAALMGVGLSMRAVAFSIAGLTTALNLLSAPFVTVGGLAVRAAATITVYAAQSIAAATATTAAWVIANAPIVAIGVAIAGIGLAAVQLAGGFRAVGQAAASALQPIAGWAGSAGASIGTAFGTVLSDAKTVFSDLYSTAATTFGGISDALAMGDFAAAGEIAWLGLQAVWQRGVAAIMSYTDPFVEYLQNIWGNVSTFTLNVVDSLFTNLQAGFRTGFAVIQGVVDNVVNGIVGTFDELVTTIRVMWTRVQGLITGAKDTEQRVSQIRDEAAARAEQRQQERPGIAGRLEAAAEANMQGQSDLQARQDRRIGDNADAQADRASRTDERSAERQQAINETNLALEEKRAELAERRAELDAQVAAGGAGGADGAGGEQLALAGGEQLALAGGATPSRSEVAGTFSAAAVGGLGIGSSVMDRIAKASEETAKNTAAFSAQEVVE
jgi:TP901 family phage tail tape measure protein